MGLFRRKEKRNITEESIDDLLLRALKPLNTISIQQAMNIPSLAGCVEYITNSIAMLPIKLYRETNDEIEELKTDKRVFLLNDDTGDLMDGFQMKKAFVRDFLLNGSAYIYINKDRNEVKSLHYVKHSAVSINKNTDPIFKQADIMVNGQTYREFEFLKITRNTENGIKGMGVIDENNTILTVSYNALMFENRITKNGGNKKGFLQSEKKLSEGALTAIKEAWRDLYSDNSDNMLVLNEGVKFQESSNTLVEMQLNENKISNANEICKLLNLSVKAISGEIGDSEYASVFKTAILPIIKAIETSLNKNLLLESEKETDYFAFDITESLKGDMLKRYQAYEVALKGNFMQPDEVRYKEDLKPLGLDFIKLGLNDVLYNPKTKEVYTPNTNKTTKLNEPDGSSKDEKID